MMAESPWLVKEHVINASCGRDYPRSVRNEETDRLRLAVKQWIPKRNQTPRTGDVSIIFCHGVGSTKESYEPFFDELLEAGTNIHSIWAIDATSHGASFLLNQERIGDEPSFMDAARDVLHMVNTFQQDMSTLKVGIGQSWGPDYLIAAASMNPRMFCGIVAMEPTFSHRFNPVSFKVPVWMAKKRDVWSSRQAAREDLRSSAYFKPFDARVFEKIMEYDLRDVEENPQEKGSENSTAKSEPAVTFTTPTAQEVYTMIRQDCRLPGMVWTPANRREEAAASCGGFWRPESIYMEKMLPSVYPPILYVWGKISHFATLDGYRKFILNSTGVGPGGGGGVQSGQVSEAWVPGADHPIPLEQPRGAALASAQWINSVASKWMEESQKARQEPFYTATLNPVFRQKLEKL